jgi:hypothetical protein
MRTLLGDMYDKYDMFNLCLNTVATAVSANNFAGSANDQQCLLRVSGIPFINNTYNVNNENNENNEKNIDTTKIDDLSFNNKLEPNPLPISDNSIGTLIN